MNFYELIPAINGILWFISILFLYKASRNQFEYIKSLHDYLKAVDKGTRSVDEAFLLKLESLEERVTYLHKVFFTNRQTVSTKIELLESDINVINTILGYAPGQMQYAPKDVAERSDADEGLEQRE